MIQDLSGLFVNEFVRSKYASVDSRVLNFFFSRKCKGVVVNSEGSSTVARFNDPARAKHVAINGHSQLGCEFNEERGR